MSQPAKAERAAHAQRVCPKCNHSLIARTVSPPDLISLMCCACNWKGACLWLDPDPAHTDSIRRENEPEPDDEPDGGRLGERVEALDIATAEAIKRIHAQLRDIREHLGTNDDKTGLSGQLDALRGRVAALEQPPAPEPVDRSAATEKSRAWCESEEHELFLDWLRSVPSAPCRQFVRTAIPDALEAVPELVRALNEQPPPDAADSWWCRELAGALHVPPADGNELLHRLRARLDAYRTLHRAAADTKKRDWHSIELSMALRTLEQLGAIPDKPPAPVHDDSSLDPPRPVARCERCGGRPEQHPGEPTCHELLQLWRRLSDGYGVTMPGALAEVALKAEEMVRLQAKELLATKDVTAELRDELAKKVRLIGQLRERVDELSGIHQQLLEAVDGEPDATTEELLASVLRRVKPVQYLIETREPEDLKEAAAGLEKLCHSGSLGRCISGLLRKVAAIGEEEQD